MNNYKCPICGKRMLVVRSVFPGERGSSTYSCMVALREPGDKSKRPRRKFHEFYDHELSESRQGGN